MMLTLKQPVYHGYHTVHDLPTPPSTSRPSPPLTVQESSQKPLSAFPRKASPSFIGMSAPHRGLPLPAAMTIAQTAPPPGPSLHSQGPPPPAQSQMLGTLPAPPQWQGQGPGTDESMRSWLMAKTEEERRRQEEEKTRQETLRLEQRRLEHDMLRTSLDEGIPPHHGTRSVCGDEWGEHYPQAALEWAQQYLAPQHSQPPQLLPAQGQISPEHRRDSLSHQYAPYAGSVGVPSTPGSGPGPQGGFVPYQGPGSPTRARAHTMSMAGGPSGRSLGGSLPRLSTGEAMGGPSVVPSHATHFSRSTTSSSAAGNAVSFIYFHHWQPPTSQAGSNQPAAPSGSSKTQPSLGFAAQTKGHGAAGPAAQGPSSQIRYRSPPFSQSGGPSTLGHPPPGRRRGHSRQQSDISAYRSTRGRGDSFGPARAMSPGLGTPREGGAPEGGSMQPRGTHSVSSLLSEQPSPRYAMSEMRNHPQGEERRQSPVSSEERSRGGAAGLAPLRDGDREHD
ncbi:hypothetical protein PG994_001952 [Apiospora phragmitis]|uniref:Uncharacterized protein n=1 Tax=Apiospora phragmitis TaxID=2905665 RepID=A0ABR1WUZ0_9PEZI